jgi:hypothetical protein
MPLIYLWDKSDRMLLRHALPARFSQLHLCPVFRSIFFFKIMETVPWVRHSQPNRPYGRFDAFVLHSRMLTFSEWRIAEQFLSQRGIIRKPRGIASGLGPCSTHVRGVFFVLWS